MSHGHRPYVSSIVGRNIKAEMARHDVSQSRLGARLGITQQGVSARLQGKTRITVDELVEIAGEIGVTVEALLEGASA